MKTKNSETEVFTLDKVRKIYYFWRPCRPRHTWPHVGRRLADMQTNCNHKTPHWPQRRTYTHFAEM